MEKTIVYLSAPLPYTLGEEKTKVGCRAIIEHNGEENYLKDLEQVKRRFAIDNNLDMDNITVTVISRG